MSLRKQAKMSFNHVSFKNKLVSLVSLKKQAKTSSISVSFKKEAGESGESQKTSKNEFHFCELFK